MGRYNNASALCAEASCSTAGSEPSSIESIQCISIPQMSTQLQNKEMCMEAGLGQGQGGQP